MTRRFQHLIGGVEVDSPTHTLSRNSSNLADVLGEFPNATREQVRLACQSARNASVAWKRTPAPIRGEIIGNIGGAIAREKEALSRLVSREMGKTLKEARGDVQEAIDTCHFFQSEGRRLYGQTVPSEMPNKELMTYRRPLGVAGIVTADPTMPSSGIAYCGANHGCTLMMPDSAAPVTTKAAPSVDSRLFQ